MPTTPSTINYYIAADGTLRDGAQGAIAQTPRIYYGTEYAVTLSFPPFTIAEGDQLQVAVNRSRTFFSSASATGDAPVAAVAKHDVTAEEAAAQAVTLTLSTNTRAMIDQVNGIDHPVRGFFGVHVLRGQSFVTLAVADALMMSLESGPDAISPSLPVVDYPTREEAEALTDRSEAAAERAEQAAAGIVPPLQLDAPPTASTVGSVGQLAVWHDGDNNKDHTYHLCYITEGESSTLYHWEECVLESARNVAGGFAGLDINNKVSRDILPIASSLFGVVKIGQNSFGINNINGELRIRVASNAEINRRDIVYCPIAPYTLDYAVRSVLPNVTEIPSATSDYSLVDSSATTNNHSHVYSHSPSSTAPTYRLPQVTNTTISHYIELTVDFTNVQTYSFLDYQGEPIVPLFTPAIAAGDVYTFKMEYSAIKAAWLIYPQKQGAVADDFVMRGEVGAANGVPSLNANGKVTESQLPIASTLVYGVVKGNNSFGVTTSNGELRLFAATDDNISTRSILRAITPEHLNFAVTAAITDANHITLNDEQKAVAQSVFGVGGPITAIPAATSAYTLAEGIFTHSPTNAPTYTLPNITDDIRMHDVVLIIDFSSVQTFSFLVDGGGDVTFQRYANPTMGEVWAFRCWWYGGKWRIMPMKIKNCVTRQLTGGSLAITDAVAGDALALKMVAPRSVVVNQLVQNGDLSDGVTGWNVYSSSNISFEDNKIKCTLTQATNQGVTALLGNSIPQNHIVLLYVTNIDWTNVHDTAFALLFGGNAIALQNTSIINKKLTMNSEASSFTIRVSGAHAEVGDYFTIAGPAMCVDLTQYFNGDTTLIDSITSWDDLVAYDPRFASYVQYNTGEVCGVTPAVSINNGTPITSPIELFAVGNAADEYEAVSGVTTRKMGSVDLGTLDWTDYYPVTNIHPYGYTVGVNILPAKLPGQQNMMAAGYATIYAFSPDKIIFGATSDGRVSLVDSSLIGKTGAEIKTALSGVILYYELATPTTSTSTPTQISLQAGSNVAMQTDGGRLAPIDITYESDEL